MNFPIWFHVIPASAGMTRSTARFKIGIEILDTTQNHYSAH